MIQWNTPSPSAFRLIERPEQRRERGSISLSRSATGLFGNCGEPPNRLGGFIRSLLEGHYREAERVVLIMNQFNTHSPASLSSAGVTQSWQPSKSSEAGRQVGHRLA